MDKTNQYNQGVLGGHTSPVELNLPNSYSSQLVHIDPRRKRLFALAQSGKSLLVSNPISVEVDLKVENRLKNVFSQLR